MKLQGVYLEKQFREFNMNNNKTIKQKIRIFSYKQQGNITNI